MTQPLTPQSFVDRWKHAVLNESAAYVSHFEDVCRLAGHPTPVQMDPKGRFYRYQAPVKKVTGGDGFADVWYRDHFVWEYKGKHADLNKAFLQVMEYSGELGNPPLLIVSDLEKILIHTNFTGAKAVTITITLDDLAVGRGLDALRNIFFNPEAFRVDEAAQQATKEAAAQFSRLADLLRGAGHDPHAVAHFLIRLLFCLYAEDSNLLPARVMTQAAINFRERPDIFTRQLSSLFEAMMTGGGFGMQVIEHFNGHLFDDTTALNLGRDGLEILIDVAALDWSSIEPSIFGTLFERSLDPSKRSQLGAHYTDASDILLIIEPVLMDPLRRKWVAVKTQAIETVNRREGADAKTRAKLDREISDLLMAFAADISAVQVLDPACGSGNFLYLALRQLLDLWQEVIDFLGYLGLPTPLKLDGSGPSPAQLHGIEINEYAHQLAQTSIWIGYLQWMAAHGYGHPVPVLKMLGNILNMDAILAYDAEGKPYEPEWPEADVIIGNPPFLGGNRIRQELGDNYIDHLFQLYKSRVPASADLVCYWFEKSRLAIEAGSSERAGLLATQAIRGGVNRVVLEKIKETGNIFWAYSDRNWILNGATVHVSMVGFDANKEKKLFLNDRQVNGINPDLSTSADLTTAGSLSENMRICFRPDEKGGPFDITEKVAKTFLSSPINPNGRSNIDVVRPYFNAKDITQHWQHFWIIDFGCEMSLAEASLYEKPFEYVKEVVKPIRDRSRGEKEREYWWLHRRPAPDMREAVKNLKKYIVTPRVSKHRLFLWLEKEIIPDSSTYVFAREDDYFIGILHALPHELWARATGTQLREAESGFRYTPKTCFETFPFPWPPGNEPQGDPRVRAIAEAARELVRLRDNWLNPPGCGEAELKKRSLTNLYNQRPTWLENAHRKLDRAVFAAYGWPDTLTDEQILERLLELNLQRAAKQGTTAETAMPADADGEEG